MIDSNFYDPCKSSPRRAVVSRADLLRAWFSADFETAMWLANELEFEFVPPQPKATIQTVELVGSMEPLTPTTDGLYVPVAKPSSSEPSVAFWLPTRYERMHPDANEGSDTPEGVMLTSKLEWTARPVPLPRIGLATWPEAKTRLSPILEPARRSPRIDIDKVVDLLSRGRPFRRLPTETHFRLERAICVVEDRSARLIPYHDDQSGLIGQLKIHLPLGYFLHLACDDPSRIVDPNRSAELALRSSESHEVAAGSHVLVLGDLGILGPSVHQMSRWHEWIYELIRRDCRVSVLVPFPLDRVPSPFYDIAQFYSWQTSDIRSVRDQKQRADLVAQILSRLSAASSFDPVLLRWVRQTVPGADDVSLESLVWQHPSLDSNQYASAKNDRTESKAEFRTAMHALPDETKRHVLRLLRRSRASIPDDPSLWLVELLNLTPDELQLVDNSVEDWNDAQRALRFLDAMREDRDLGRSVTGFLKWFTARVEKNGVWASKPEIRERIRQWQRELHPTSFADGTDDGGKTKPAVRSIGIQASSGRLEINLESGNEARPGNAVALESSGQKLSVYGTINRERAFWKSGIKPDWVSDYGTDEYGAWCEFQVPRFGDDGLVTQRLRWIPPGEFMMGSPESDAVQYTNEGPQHLVRLTTGYWLADTQVTQELWEAISGGENPSHFKGDTRPVEKVSWDDCQTWLRKLKEHCGTIEAFLPSEAQWEYACRAGTQTAYSFGDAPGELSNYAWYGKNSNGSTHPVKQLLPNAWGLYDMHGNVWEWCNDWLGFYKSKPQTDPTGPVEGSYRVGRGGGYGSPSGYCRSARRDDYSPGFRNDFLGFRLALGSVGGAEPSEGASTPAAEPGVERVSKGLAPAAPRPVRRDSFWKSGKKPEWVSDYGTDHYGAWCEFQVPRYFGDGMVTQRLRWIPPGEFMMGSPESENPKYRNEPFQQIRLFDGFWLADTPVTQDLWTAITGGVNPSRHQGASHPIDHGSWSEFNRWIDLLKTRLATSTFSLPNEIQWEYACRAGSGDAYCFGNDPSQLPNYAWFNVNSVGHVHPVKQLRPNGWGLYDMHGNVWEWCSDIYSIDRWASRKRTVAGKESLVARVFRGGNCLSDAIDLRSSNRSAHSQSVQLDFVGFRLLCLASGAEPSEVVTTPAAEPGVKRARMGSALREYAFLRSLDLDGLSPRELRDGVADLDFRSLSSVRVISDKAGYQFDRITKPAWAVEFGSDEYGLYATFEVQPIEKPSAKPSRSKRRTKKGQAIPTAVRQRMRWIPPGRFLMGSPEGEAGRDHDEIQHWVNITHGYWMFDAPCTQALWECVMGVNPSFFKDPERPVEQVSWGDVSQFVSRLHERLPQDLRFRLPTEAEWEYACRAGTTPATYAGDLEFLGDANAPLLDAIAWYGGNSGRKYDLQKSRSLDRDWLTNRQYPDKAGGTRKVAQKAPNGWGLYDTLGNVWEWCLDWHGDYDSSEQTDPVGPAEGTFRVFRGGSWFSAAAGVRAACRNTDPPDDQYSYLGFRLVSSAFDPNSGDVLPVSWSKTDVSFLLTFLLEDKEDETEKIHGRADCICPSPIGIGNACG